MKLFLVEKFYLNNPFLSENSPYGWLFTASEWQQLVLLFSALVGIIMSIATAQPPSVIWMKPDRFQARKECRSECQGQGVTVVDWKSLPC